MTRRTIRTCWGFWPAPWPSIFDIPFPGPVAAVRVGKRDGELVINPTISDQEQCALNLVVAGTEDSILMVEGGGRQNSEAKCSRPCGSRA